MFFQRSCKAFLEENQFLQQSPKNCGKMAPPKAANA